MCFSSSPAECRAILVASKESSFGLSSIRRLNGFIPAPTIATRFFIPRTSPSFPAPLLPRSLSVFLSSSERQLSSPSESAGVLLVPGVARLLRAFCGDRSPLGDAQLPTTRLTRLQATARLYQKRRTQPSCQLYL